MGAARWVIIGSRGRVGRALVAALAGETVREWTREDADLTDQTGVRDALAAIRGESDARLVCINAAAVADVDAAERDPATAELVNGLAPGWLAEGLGEDDVLVHLSTDYVFGGDAGTGARSTPYDEDAPTDPLSAYGRTKRAGEQAVLAARPDSYVVRTSWIFDTDKPNFAMLFRDRLLAGEVVEAVTDQVSRPTATADLVDGLIALARRRPEPGIYHFANSGEASRYDVACAVAAEFGVDPDLVRPIRTEQAPPRPAVRPSYSVLGLRRWVQAGLTEPRGWRAALHAVMSGAVEPRAGFDAESSPGTARA